MDNLICKPIPSKPGMMAYSNGSVKLPASKAAMPYGGEREYKTKPTTGAIYKAGKNARHCYYGINSSKFGTMKVHRLVCEAFHGEPPSAKSVVLHLNENALDNRPENLKWGTQKENLNMPGFIKYCKGRTGENSPRAKYKAKRISETPPRLAGLFMG